MGKAKSAAYPAAGSLFQAQGPVLWQQAGMLKAADAAFSRGWLKLWRQIRRIRSLRVRILPGLRGPDSFRNGNPPFRTL